MMERNVRHEAEEQARQLIDERLAKAGWVVQVYKRFNLGVTVGVAIRDFSVFTCTKNMP
jgi:type I site-specific restriction endonuclease